MQSKGYLLSILSLEFLSCCLAYTVRRSTIWRQGACRTLTELSASRRELIFQSSVCACAVILSGFLAATPSVASDGDLFKPNPLTNPFLEQIRIWEQAEADELKYGGELAPGDAGNKGKVEAYPRLLVPILEIADELQTVNDLVRHRESWTQAQTILKQPKYEKITFKKIFNAYGDNIYYSDPDRANLYLGGGATPKVRRPQMQLHFLVNRQRVSRICLSWENIDRAKLGIFTAQ